jgi:hypothetical protein
VSPEEIVPALPRVVAAGVLDAELAALACLLLEDGVPVLVAGPVSRERDVLLDALLTSLPAARRPDRSAPAGEHRVVRVGVPLSVATPPGPLRAALAATTGRSGIVTSCEAADLAGVIAVLHGQGLTDDEISFLGMVLILGPVGARGPANGALVGRVMAAHYLRPVARDGGGHVQRLGPAVLATWDSKRGRYDHFEWGIYPELAARTGRRGGDLERVLKERAERFRPAVRTGLA